MVVDYGLARDVDTRTVGVEDIRPLRSFFIAVAIEVAERAARAGDDLSAGTRGDHPRIDARGQADDLVPVLRPREVDVPVEILRPDGLQARSELDAAVADFAGVDVFRADTRAVIHRGVDDLVGGRVVVECSVEGDAVLQEFGL